MVAEHRGVSPSALRLSGAPLAHHPTAILPTETHESLPSSCRHSAGRDAQGTATCLPILGHVEQGATGRRLAWSTAIFSLATGLSRILGLVREIVAAYYFSTKGRLNAFTVAFQVPNLF